MISGTKAKLCRVCWSCGVCDSTTRSRELQRLFVWQLGSGVLGLMDVLMMMRWTAGLEVVDDVAKDVVDGDVVGSRVDSGGDETVRC